MGKVQFSAHFDLLAKDLLKRLLVSDRTKRLGNLKVNIEQAYSFHSPFSSTPPLNYDREDQKM